MNLLTDPWIRTTDGDLLSLNKLFTVAHTVPDIYALNPTLEIGLYRFLVAMLQDAFFPSCQEDIDGIGDLSYVKRVFAKNNHLFDMDRFYQVEEETDPIKSVARIMSDAATGNNTTHFSQRYDDEHRYCLSCCAHALIAIPCTIFGTGGGYYANPVGSVLYWVPLGANLAEILKACLIPTEGYDRLWWNRPNVVEGKKKPSASYLEILTFSSRRVKLIIDGPGRCTYCGQEASETVAKIHYAPGYGLEQESKGTLVDPWVSYRKKDSRPIFVRASPEKTPEEKIDALKVEDLNLAQTVRGAQMAKVYGFSYENAKVIECYQFTRSLTE
jgi:CRISPR type I-E-associated protein CasA/Cse1